MRPEAGQRVRAQVGGGDKRAVVVGLVLPDGIGQQTGGVHPLAEACRHKPEIFADLPEKVDKLTLFQKLLFLRVFRLDKLVPAISQFVSAEIGQKFIEPPPFDLPLSFATSTPATPLIFVLSMVGGYASTERMFDVWLMLILGVGGYLMRKLDYPVAPAVLATKSGMLKPHWSK